MRRHKVTRKTKSGKTITYWRGSGSPSGTTPGKEYERLKTALENAEDNARRLARSSRSSPYSRKQANEEVEKLQSALDNYTARKPINTTKGNKKVKSRGRGKKKRSRTPGANMDFSTLIPKSIKDMKIYTNNL